MQRGGLSQVVMVNPVFLILRTPAQRRNIFAFSRIDLQPRKFSVRRFSHNYMYIRRDITASAKIANSQKFIDISVCTSEENNLLMHFPPLYT